MLTSSPSGERDRETGGRGEQILTYVSAGGETVYYRKKDVSDVLQIVSENTDWATENTSKELRVSSHKGDFFQCFLWNTSNT